MLFPEQNSANASLIELKKKSFLSFVLYQSLPSVAFKCGLLCKLFEKCVKPSYNMRNTAHHYTKAFKRELKGNHKTYSLIS